MAKRGKEQQDYLIFVDTNVFLDLYRSRGDSTPAYLEKLTDCADRLIGTFQVREEFERNRIKVIQATMGEFKLPPPPKVPSLFADAKAKSGFERAQRDLAARHKAMKDRLARAIQKPGGDPAYTLTKKVLSSSAYWLDYDAEEASSIIKRATLRAARGSPPKKDRDATLGDAINWEWCLHVCSGQSKDLVIVSRDSDYGARVGNRAVPNTFLTEEFKRRVSKKRKLVLTPQLTEALKLLGGNISKKDQEEEKASLTVTEGLTTLQRSWTIEDFAQEVLRKLFAQSDDETSQGKIDVESDDKDRGTVDSSD